MFDAGAAARPALPRALHLAAQGAGGRRRAQPAGAARRHRAIARARAATRFTSPAIAIRTGDTPATERARFQREPADILITTPESLYLLLTSNAREALRVDRHGHHRRDPRAGADQARRAPGAVARTAGGDCDRAACSASACRPRSGRSTRWRGSSAARAPATQGRSRGQGHGERHEAERGSDATPDAGGRDPRRVRRATGARRATAPSPSSTPAQKKQLELRIEVPVEDMARLGQADDIPSGPASVRRRRGRRSGRRSTRGCSS